MVCIARARPVSPLGLLAHGLSPSVEPHVTPASLGGTARHAVLACVLGESQDVRSGIQGSAWEAETCQPELLRIWLIWLDQRINDAGEQVAGRPGSGLGRFLEDRQKRAHGGEQGCHVKSDDIADARMS
jgi:hypothetical protein